MKQVHTLTVALAHHLLQSNAQPGSSLRLVPGAPSTTSVSVTSTSHPVHAGVHDTMRYGPRNLAEEASSASGQHPLQHRLENWELTRDNLKLTMQRNMFGMAAPIRTLMERRIVEHVSMTGSRKPLVCILPNTFTPCAEPTLSRFASDTDGCAKGHLGVASRHPER